eukprot:TRINITY_DN69451_c0_g1_i1.p1 TRINITY_DN69451_c0_g1~~TRINITY_DN69451_c0_g1_i1.p1  ORF type:complete len:308 (+),score=8.79 TRINITY_DN69451_c0_g1_i1:28-951(+)
MTTRSATHAGTWYSDDPKALDSQIDQWFTQAETHTNQPIRAVIAPHAGLRFSGWTSSHAYKHIDLTGVKRIFLLGPAHHEYLPCCGLTPFKNYETPLGDLAVDLETVNNLYNMSTAEAPFKVVDGSVDEAEHSIELHLPFVAKLLQVVTDNRTSIRQDIKIVPIIVGSVSSKQEANYGKVLASYLVDPANFFCISSDFCHWGSRFNYQPYDSKYRRIFESIIALDHQGIDLIEGQNVEGWKRYLDEKKNTVCGRHPISVLLEAMRASHKQFNVAKVHYSQSNQVVSKTDSSVSYAAILISENAIRKD